ncbi:hypothetical protein ACK3TF_003349 [Chlorella vulgaris]
MPRRDSKKLKWPGCCSVLLARTEPHTLSGPPQEVQGRYRNPHLMPTSAPQSTDEVPVEGVREQVKKDIEAVTADSRAKHERLMAQMQQELAARQAAFWNPFRTPPPFSPEVAAAFELAHQLREQTRQELARAAEEKEREQARADAEQRQKARAAAEQKEKARAAAEEQRQKAEARRAALLEPIPLERKNQ